MGIEKEHWEEKGYTHARSLCHFWCIVRRYEERVHFHEFINKWTFLVDAVSDDQYTDIVAPPCAGRPLSIPTPSSVNNDM